MCELPPVVLRCPNSHRLGKSVPTDLGDRNMTLRQFMDRYGVALGVVLGLVVVVALLPGNATSDRLAAGGGDFESGELAEDGTAGDLGVAAGTDGAAAG